MDIDLYADVEDFNSDDAVPNSEDVEPKAKSKNSENGGDDVDLYDDVIASSSAATNEDKKEGEEAKPDAKGGDAYQRPGRKYQASIIAWLKFKSSIPMNVSFETDNEPVPRSVDTSKVLFV